QGVTPAHKGLAPSRLIIYLSVNKRCPCWAHTICIVHMHPAGCKRTIQETLAFIVKKHFNNHFSLVVLKKCYEKFRFI
ncbi:hypothetical protein ACIGCP_19710, partial [Cellulophaga baltica]|uniref:hypothetical protein n=1 Tax=Cellulophaga baltica TaxID=76594 RepID=UPI0037CA2763